MKHCNNTCALLLFIKRKKSLCTLLFALLQLYHCDNVSLENFINLTQISELHISVGLSTLAPEMKGDTFYVSVPYAMNVNSVVPIFKIPDGATSEPTSSNKVTPQNFEFEILVKNVSYLRRYRVIINVGYPDIEFKPFFPEEKKLFTLGDVDSRYLFMMNNASGLQESYKNIFIKVDRTSYRGIVTSYKGKVYVGFSEEFKFNNWNSLFSNSTIQLFVSSVYLNQDYTSNVIEVTRTPYNEIYNWQDLQSIYHKLDGKYVLKKDISLPEPNTQGVIFSGFKTISPDTNNVQPGYQGHPFTGSLDGNGFRIKKIAILNKDNDYVGIFGRVFGGRIQNLHVEVDSIVGRSYVGIIAGLTEKTTFSQVGIDNGKVVGQLNIGGIAGGTIAGIVEKCYSSAMVYGSTRIGGIIGSCESDSLRDSYFNGTVTTIIREGGGIAGYNNSKISRCYSSTSKTDTRAINIESFTGKNAGIIERSYWEKDFSGFEYGSAFSFSHRRKIVVYGDKFLDSGQNDLEIFLGWDFINKWASQGNGKLPILKWQ